MDEVRIPRAGYPFTSFAPAEGQDHPHACLYGLLFLTYTVFDEELAEEVERIEALPCRRCAAEAGREMRRILKLG
jgi:hypothetical protein